MASVGIEEEHAQGVAVADVGLVQRVAEAPRVAQPREHPTRALLVGARSVGDPPGRVGDALIAGRHLEVGPAPDVIERCPGTAGGRRDPRGVEQPEGVRVQVAHVEALGSDEPAGDFAAGLDARGHREGDRAPGQEDHGLVELIEEDRQRAVGALARHAIDDELVAAAQERARERRGARPAPSVVVIEGRSPKAQLQLLGGWMARVGELHAQNHGRVVADDAEAAELDAVPEASHAPAFARTHGHEAHADPREDQEEARRAEEEGNGEQGRPCEEPSADHPA